MKRLLIFCLGAAFFAAGSGLRAVDYRFINIVDNTTSAPIGVFNDFGVPSISGDVVAFRAAYTGTSDSGSGIFTGNGQSLQTIVKQGDAAPSGVFGYFVNDPTISGSLVAFRGSFASTTGVFVGGGSALTTIALPGDTTPRGTLSHGSELGDPVISNGMVAVRNGYTSDKKGIVMGSGGPLTPIVTTGDPSPIGTFGFGQVGHPAISNGNVAFLGGGGISVGNGGPLTTIVKLGDPAPVGTFSNLGQPSIDGDAVAFGGTFAASGGIFVSVGGTMTTIIQTGDTAPVGTFSGVSTPSISGDEVAFFASFNGIAPRGVFIHSDGQPNPVITTGSNLFGSFVFDLDFSRFGFDPDGSGRVAFRYQLADDRYGIAIAIPVPESSTMRLLGLGALFASLFARRHRGAP